MEVETGNMEKTKSSCAKNTEIKDLPVRQKPNKYKANYGQIRYLMKRLNAALTDKLREGRPSKFCRLCKAELQSISERYPRAAGDGKRIKRRSHNVQKKRKLPRMTSKNVRQPNTLSREVKRKLQKTGDLCEKDTSS